MGVLQVGYTDVDITPPIGAAMAGYAARDRPSEGIEIPLSAQAVVLSDGDSHAALVHCDLIAIGQELTQNVREKVTEATDVPGEAVILSASHTHWGPEVRPAGYLPERLRACVRDEYIEELARALTGAVVEARGNLRPARAGWGVGWAGPISYNRRPVKADGQVDGECFRLDPEQAQALSAAGAALRRAWPRGGWGGPRLSPPVEEVRGLHAGVTDPEVPVLRVEGEDGQPMVCLVNFACHPVCGGEEFYWISPDYPHFAREAFRGIVGAPLCFSLGCAGDQVPAWRGGDSRQRVGHSVGAAAAAAWHQIQECHEQVRVGAARMDVTLAVKDLPAVEEARLALANHPDPEGPSAASLRNQLALAERYGDKGGIATEVCALRVGDWAAVGLPGEILAEIGLQIKQRSPFRVTSVISLANHSVGYVSTARAHEEGGYEPAWSAPGPGAERQLVDAGLELLNALMGKARP